MSIRNKIINSWVNAHGFDQPYGSSPHIVRILVLEKEIWIDISAIDPKYFDEFANEEIARYFLALGRNEMRKAINNLLKPEDMTFADDPYDLNY